MSRFTPRDVERVELGDGDWVEIRTRLSYGDRAAIEEKLLGPRIQKNGIIAIDAAAGAHLAAGNIELLVRSVVAWGGPGFCERDHPHDGACQIAAIDADTIARLDVTAERILDEIVRRSKARATPDFTRPPSPGTSTGGAADPTPPSAPPSSPSVADTAGASAS